MCEICLEAGFLLLKHDEMDTGKHKQRISQEVNKLKKKLTTPEWALALYRYQGRIFLPLHGEFH